MEDLTLVLNVVVAGVLTGMVYGLMALGLSVIFGVMRVVNFAHGELTTIAMYGTAVACEALALDPFYVMLPLTVSTATIGLY